MTINQKICIFAIVLGAVMSFLSPIIFYEYKILSCAMAEAEKYKKPSLENYEWSKVEAWKSFCHGRVNGNNAN